MGRGRKNLIEEPTGLARRDREHAKAQIDEVDVTAALEAPAPADGRGQAHLPGGGYPERLSSRLGLRHLVRSQLTKVYAVILPTDPGREV